VTNRSDRSGTVPNHSAERMTDERSDPPLPPKGVGTVERGTERPPGSAASVPAAERSCVDEVAMSYVEETEGVIRAAYARADELGSMGRKGAVAAALTDPQVIAATVLAHALGETLPLALSDPDLVGVLARIAEALEKR
jgi:hypothetical protein